MGFENMRNVKESLAGKNRTIHGVEYLYSEKVLVTLRHSIAIYGS